MEEQIRIIQQLRNSLSAIDNARKQVEETVAAYKGAEKHLGTLTDNMVKIERALDSLIAVLNTNEVTLQRQSTSALEQLRNACKTVVGDTKRELSSASTKLASVLNDTKATLKQQSAKSLSELQDACNKIVDNTKYELLSASQDFKKSTNGSIGRLDAAVMTANTLKDKIETTIAEISKLVEDVSSLQNDLKSSQAAQDVAIDKISVSTCNIIGILSNQNDTLVQLKQTIDTISASARNIIDSLSTQANTLMQLNQTIQSSFEKLQKSELTNKRIIIISAVIIVVVQLVMMFISQAKL